MILTDANLWVALHDERDEFHEQSLKFFRRTFAERVQLHAPAILLIEVACSIARRSRSAATGRAVANKVEAHPALFIWPLDDALLDRARDCGTRAFLRAGDAFYAASAELSKSQLVTWDVEFARRAGGLTPPDWLEANR